MATTQQFCNWVVVHIITRLDLGGAQLATLREVADQRANFSRRLLLYGEGGLLESDLDDYKNVEWVKIKSLRRELDPLQDLYAVYEIAAVLRRIQKESSTKKILVHTHSSKAGILGRLAAKISGVHKIIHSIHGFGHSHHGSAWQRAIFLNLERAVGKITDGFTADSAANIHQGIGDNIIGDTPTRVVHCGVKMSQFMAVDQQKDSNQSIILNISCLKIQKDPLTFIAVAKEVLKTHPDTLFLLVGDGELRACVESRIADYGIGDSVQLLGWRRDIRELLASADLLLLTSLWEGLPQVFGQAMSMGVPIIATHVDGAPEAIVHGCNGILHAPKDSLGMARSVCELLDNKKLRNRFAKEGHGRVRQLSNETMLAGLRSFYRSVLF